MKAVGQRSAEDDEAPFTLSSRHRQLPPEAEGFHEGAELALAHPEGMFRRDQIELRAVQSPDLERRQQATIFTMGATPV